MEIYFDNNLIDEDYYTALSTNFVLFEDTFYLGSTASNTYNISIDKTVISTHPNIVTIKNNNELIATLVVDKIEENDFEYKYTLTDKMVDLEFEYDASLIFNNGSATLLQIVQDICSKTGIELATTDFRGYDKSISWYDNTITAREYIGYIAELNGGYAQIGKDGKLYFIKQNTTSAKTISIDDCSDFQIGEKHTITRVVYELGSLKYEYGDETGNTLYLSEDNVFITEQSEVEEIFNEINGFEFYSFKTNNCPIDYDIMAGQVITFTDGVNNYPTIVGYDLTYNGGWYGGYNLDVATKKQEETQVVGTSEKIRKLSIKVDRDNNKITQLAQETSENTEKIAEHEISIDEISNKVSNIADLTKTVTDTKKITLDNCANGELLQLNIYGNNTAFKQLVLNDDLYLSDNLYLQNAESILIVTDEKGNTTNYDLKIKDTLRQNGNIKDEYILDSGKAKIIRRINQDGSIKDNEETEDLGELHIILEQGKNTIQIKDFSAEMQVKWAQKSDLTDTFATKVQLNTSITQTSTQIMTEVNKKVDEEELGTKIIQDYESVQVAWNKISDFIKMMVFNNNASLCIVDGSNNVIASFDKDGEHFYKSGEATPFGEMGVQTVDDNQYISFSVEGEYDTAIYNGMAWGIKTKSDGKFYPIFYIKDFTMGAKDSDAGSGSLVLTGCNIVLDGFGTGIRTGGVDIYGDPGGTGLYFNDVNDIKQNYIHIYPKNILDEASIDILDKIQFFKNQAGTNSFLIGEQNGDHCLFTSDGSIYGKTLGVGSNVYIDSNGDVTGDLTFYSLPSYQGDTFVYGEGHRYHLKWTGSELQFWVDSTNVGTLSDRRLKKEIQNIDEDFIKAIEEIEMKQFKVANRNGLISFGIMAQDLIEIFEKYNKNPFDYEIVFKTKYRTDDDTIYYAVNYEQFLILKQKANDIKLKKQQEIIEQLQEKIKEMEDKING